MGVRSQVQLVELAENLEVVLPFPSIREALSAEEQYLKQWHDEAAQHCAERQCPLPRASRGLRRASSL